MAAGTSPAMPKKPNASKTGPKPGSFNMGAKLIQANGKPIPKSSEPDSGDATLGDILYSLLSRNGAENDLAKAVRLNLLAQRIDAAGDGEFPLTANEIAMIEEQLKGQSSPIIFSILSIIDPAYIEKIAKGEED